MGGGEENNNNDINNNNNNSSAKNILLPHEIGTDFNFKRKIVWFNAIGFLVLHLCALYGFYQMFFSSGYTAIWGGLYAFVSGIGVTMGAHRYYAHKCFKATFSARLLMVLLHTVAGQNSMYVWVRDHRLHHKYSDTDADPHNVNRGFFFAHIGWLMSKKHPAVIQKGKTIDMSDLEADWLVMFQKEFYKLLYVIFALAFPIVVPVHFWHETYWNSLFVSYFARYLLTLNVTWLINSATHLYGTKPYDKLIHPVENLWVSFVALGEGWHNYHHAFPSDYRAAELGMRYSATTLLIDAMARLGMVYDLKVAPSERVVKKIMNKGDGTHPIFEDILNNNTPSAVAFCEKIEMSKK